MSDNFNPILNKDIYDERIIRDVIHFASTKQISVEIINENIKGATVINNVTISLSKSFEFQTLTDRKKELEEIFSYIPENDSEKRLKISAKINHQEEIIKKYVQDTLKLAEEFNRIEINTDRLRRAKEFFDNGKFAEARAVFETELEQMQDEQTRLLKTREELELKLETDILPKLKNNSEEFYLLAMATQIDYDNPNQFEDTCKYFESSIKSNINKFNIYQFAFFLNEHNQFAKAEEYFSIFWNKFAIDLPETHKAFILGNSAGVYSSLKRNDDAIRKYKEALKIYRNFADNESDVDLNGLATILQNLALCNSEKNLDFEALREFEEALRIRRKLAEKDKNTYLPDVAWTLHSLASLHTKQKRYKEALAEYKEAVEIRQFYCKTRPSIFFELLAASLANLAALLQEIYHYEEALKAFEDSILLFRVLARMSPTAHLPKLATALHMQASLYLEQKQFKEALKIYEEELEIIGKLYEKMPDVYVVDLAKTKVCIAHIFLNLSDNAEAMLYAIEAFDLVIDIFETNPQAEAPFYAAVEILRKVDRNRGGELTALFQSLQDLDKS